MKRRYLSLFVAPAVAFALAACDVEQTQEGDLPDIEVEGGQLPEYDVDAADIDVTTDTTTVVVPDIDINDPDDDDTNTP